MAIAQNGHADAVGALLDAGVDPGEGRRNTDQSLPTMLPGGSPEASTFRDEARSHRDRAGIALGSRTVCVCARAQDGALRWAVDAGETPLLVACRKGNVDVVRRLLDAGQDVDGVNRHAATWHHISGT